MRVSQMRKQQAISCVLAEDHAELLRALEAMLEAEGVEVVGSAGTGIGLLQLLEARPTTAVVVDLRLPDMDGIEVARRVAEIARRKTAVIIYTSYADPETVAKALDAGARAVVLKDGSPENLLAALASIASDEIYVDPQLRRSNTEQSTCG